MANYENNWFWDPTLSGIGILEIGVLDSKNLKWNTLLVKSIFFCHFETSYCNYHMKSCSSGHESLDLNAFKTFAFCFLKRRCTQFSCISPRYNDNTSAAFINFHLAQVKAKKPLKDDLQETFDKRIKTNVLTKVRNHEFFREFSWN